MLKQVLLMWLAGVAVGYAYAADAMVTNNAAVKGDVSAVYALLDRVLPGAKQTFELELTKGPCNAYTLSDVGASGKIRVSATGVSELAAGVGHYLRQFCNMTIGWARGGGSHVFIPDQWPLIGDVPVILERNVPYSYMMNVCTFSYSFVWYSWHEWTSLIDWMALSGINNVLAMTGQEEIQYKVFRKFGLDDHTIRSWFNGPALLTWSRGQNEYGADIAGPLPRSWMKKQWSLQKQILARYRELGITFQLPAFQGNVPAELKDVLKDANMTKAGATAWMDSLDPNYGKIADEWMTTLINDFGTDHWYQLDGYFNGGTAPWMDADKLDGELEIVSSSSSFSSSSFSSPSFDPFDPSKLKPDPVWYKRGLSAYHGLTRTDPDATWSYQGFAFIHWTTKAQASSIKGFVQAVPKGKFVVIDMGTAYAANPQWQQFNRSSFFGAPFIQTTLHLFGGNDGMKGDLRDVNKIPFEALEAKSSVAGTGFTPEGIDQNPIYYEFLLDAPWRTGPIKNITHWAIIRAHRRYGLTDFTPTVSNAWSLLINTSYSNNLYVLDNTGIEHLPGRDTQFQSDRKTPTPYLLTIFRAWGQLIAAGSSIDRLQLGATFSYDLINLGREVLAQLTVPISLDFSDATKAKSLDIAALKRTGELYVELLNDIDALVATDSAFLLGPWIKMARDKAAPEDNDCGDNSWGIKTCADFYEWNARVQITTWHPVSKTDIAPPGGPIDYANKHWSGLIKDYYSKRVEVVMQQAISDAAAGKALDTKEVAKLVAEHAYHWTTSTNPYPLLPVGDPIALSQALYSKYQHYFTQPESILAFS